jgi:hypothetical protein
MAGQKPLRKRFRYRDQTGASLEAHTEHWRGFIWEAGPVCVIHKGAPWGVPQVWAASAAEGQRVIRHAAAIAGINADAPAYQWIITTSSSPRYGSPGLMAPKDLGRGAISVTKRESPNSLPLVSSPDP